MAVLPQKWPWRDWPAAELPREIPRYLADSETTIRGGQIHEAVMIKPIALFIVGTVLTFFGFANLPADADGARNVLALVWVGLLAWLAWCWFEWTRELTFITGYRMIKIEGVIIRSVRMMPIGKVTDMTYNKSPAGILLGYGTFIVESAGQDQAFYRLPYIPEPDNTYRHIQNLLFKKSPADVNILDINTTKRLNVSWAGRFRKDPDGRTGKVDQDDVTPW